MGLAFKRLRPSHPSKGTSMTKDEALKMALEKFEFMNHVDSIFHGEFDKEITAIKEALAQPEHGWTPERIAGIARLKDAQDKRLAQPEQEPVAWMDDYNACKCPDNEARCFSDKVFRMMQKHTDSLTKQQEPVAKVCHDLDGHIGWNPNLLQLPYEGTPLYTTPPQRKPLTDKEIDDIVKNYALSNPTTPLHFARAIEAAHGIKGLV